MHEQPRDRQHDGQSGDRLSPDDAIKRVRLEGPELIGRPIDAVLALERAEDRSWTVTVQVVESARTPHSADVLGSYAVVLAADGELVAYRRGRRYQRTDAEPRRR